MNLDVINKSFGFIIYSNNKKSYISSLALSAKDLKKLKKYNVLKFLKLF